MRQTCQLCQPRSLAIGHSSAEVQRQTRRLSRRSSWQVFWEQLCVPAALRSSWPEAYSFDLRG
ncbi:MAG: hypothetical protein ACTS6G_03420, partial [Candidatus Hodgkinia cicadicola]